MSTNTLRILFHQRSQGKHICAINNRKKRDRLKYLYDNS